jgi:hypothetical protein
MEQLENILEIMEVENFYKEITDYLQAQEKDRIVKERMEKNRGWFSKPKELT